MKYLLIAILALGCKKDPGKITFVLSHGAGDVIITQGDLTTDFISCPTGWTQVVEAKPKTRYTIWTNAKKYHEVRILFNGKTVAKDSVFAVYTTP